MSVNEESAGFVTALSALCPGLGQIYNGRIMRGILFVIMAVIVIISGALTMPIIGFIILPLFWICNIYDAYRITKQINNCAKFEAVQLKQSIVRETMLKEMEITKVSCSHCSQLIDDSVDICPNCCAKRKINT